MRNKIQHLKILTVIGRDITIKYKNKKLSNEYKILSCEEIQTLKVS